MPFQVDHPDVVEAVCRALQEDIGTGDVTSTACIPAAQVAEGRFIARQELVVAGVELLEPLYRLRGGIEEFRLHKASGDRAQRDEALAWVRGPARTLLECERVALNFLQRLSGVATLARRYVDAVAGTGCRILDTRKTTPGLRRLEKMAAAAGGVTNHRLGLYDAVLIKNNHISAAGGVRAALECVRGLAVPVEIEVRTQEELDQALACGATRLLLDNLTPEQAAQAVRHVAGRATIELSGGITLDNVRAYAETGADFISCGAITHSAVAVNINFRLELLRP
ncbi:MAG: carboxylating nicotinate-nucleotide diphosphorylase [Acidobacteria bacterium]|nr:carboxylating nicotinate-nucleotide diphosphorylase [Acidobacteriota bacterium]